MLYTLVRGIVIYSRIINTVQIYDISRRTTSSSQHPIASLYISNQREEYHIEIALFL